MRVGVRGFVNVHLKLGCGECLVIGSSCFNISGIRFTEIGRILGQGGRIPGPIGPVGPPGGCWFLCVQVPTYRSVVTTETSFIVILYLQGRSSGYRTILRQDQLIYSRNTTRHVFPTLGLMLPYAPVCTHVHPPVEYCYIGGFPTCVGNPTKTLEPGQIPLN